MLEAASWEIMTKQLWSTPTKKSESLILKEKYIWGKPNMKKNVNQATTESKT